jgi:hypothetical protein
MKLYRTLITIALVSLFTLALAACTKEAPAPKPEPAKPAVQAVKAPPAPTALPTLKPPVKATPVVPLAAVGLNKDERAKASKTYAIQASKVINLENVEAEAAKLEKEIEGDK